MEFIAGEMLKAAILLIFLLFFQIISFTNAVECSYKR